MERQSSTFVGDINDFAFLKSDPKQTVKELPKVVAKPQVVAKYDWYQNA